MPFGIIEVIALLLGLSGFGLQNNPKAPTPDAAYTIEMVYRQYVPPLVSNGTNWLLALAPDLYLYGALLETSPYIKEDARIQTWGLGLNAALSDLNNLGLTSTFNAGPMTIRVSGQGI